MRILVSGWDGPGTCAQSLYIAFRIPWDGSGSGGGVHRQPKTLRKKEECCFLLSSFCQAAPWPLQAAMLIPRPVANISMCQVPVPVLSHSHLAVLFST